MDPIRDIHTCLTWPDLAIHALRDGTLVDDGGDTIRMVIIIIVVVVLVVTMIVRLQDSGRMASIYILA